MPQPASFTVMMVLTSVVAYKALTTPPAVGVAISTCVIFLLTLQLRFAHAMPISVRFRSISREHCADRGDVGTLGLLAAGCQSADASVVQSGADGVLGGSVPGRGLLGSEPIFNAD